MAIIQSPPPLGRFPHVGTGLHPVQAHVTYKYSMQAGTASWEKLAA